jgi:tape measure domain-containing protein
MADDIYTIRLEDEVTAAATRARGSFQSVAAAAERLRQAMASGDAAATAHAQKVLRVAEAQRTTAVAGYATAKSLARVGQAVSGLGTQAKRSEVQVRGFSYALNGLATAAANAGFNFAGKLARGLVDVAGGLWETAELASRSRMSLGLLYGGMAEGQAAQARALQLSRQYGLSLELVLSTLNQFKGAGFNLDQSGALLQLGADLRALGSTDLQLESVFLALRKIQSQSFLQGDELNMLSEAGVSVDKIYTRLQDKLGKTREEIIKMQAARQLGSGDVLNAIAESVLLTGNASKFGEMGEKAANETLGGIKSRLLSNLGADLFEATQRAEPALVAGMQSILGGVLGSNGTTVQDQIANGLVKVGEQLQIIGPQIPGFVESIGNLASVLVRLADALTLVATPFKAVGGFIGTLLGSGNTMKLTDEAQARDVQFRNSLPSGLEPGSAEAEAWMRRAQGAASRSTDVSQDALDFGRNFSRGAADGIASEAPSVAAAAAGVAQGAVDSFKSQAEIKSPSRVMAEQGGFLVEGVAVGIEDQAEIAMRASSVMAENVVDASAGVLAPSAGAMSVGGAAGDSYSSSTTSTSNRPIIHFDVHLGGGMSPDADPVQQLRDFVELEVAAIFERHLEGAGA